MQEGGLYKLSVIINKDSRVLFGERVTNRLFGERVLFDLHQQVVDDLANKKLLKSSYKYFGCCESCLIGKSSSLPHISRSTIYKDPLSLVFDDIFGNRLLLPRKLF